jgi:3-polyprenyl-4-hydroxybenzoate decarboxylase
MSNFNISGSKIDQLNNSGNNYKQTSKEGNNAISEQGSVVQTEGTENKVEVNKPKESLLASIWSKLKSLWLGWGGQSN